MERELFTRYEENPILTPEMWPYPIENVLNPAAIFFNKKTLLLVRALDRREYSHLIVAISKDGKTGWKIDSTPTLSADLNFGEFKKGLEDPRVVWVEELQKFVIACVSFRNIYKNRPNGISLISTKDFKNFERISEPLGPDNKNASLFPKKIKGFFALIHRPTVNGRTYIAVSYSNDLVFWGKEKPLFTTREWCWDNHKIGLGCPPIETDEGWLIVYHGFGGKANRFIYRVGLALLDLKSLDLIRRSEEWVFGPKDVCDGGENGIVFPCGSTLIGENLNIYYGTDDSRIGLATANLAKVLEYIMSCPEK